MNPADHQAASSALGDEHAESEGAAPLVGAQLREKRFESGMSLRELARRLDVSPSLVSQIETGKIQPSVRTLYAIVTELGLSLDEIFELVGSGEPAAKASPEPSAPAAVATSEQPRRAGSALVHRADERRVIELETGVKWERMTAWDEPDVEFMIAVYGVGGSSSADGKLMRHSGREFGLVLSGTLHVTVGFEDHVLAPGDSITFESTIPHRLRNDGDVDVRAIWVTLGRYAPSSDQH
jgi:transcriptional regulator with XRE-family HTH domain